MPFTEEDLDSFLDAFEARDFSVRLAGVEVKTVRGIFSRATEFIGEAEYAVLRPSIRCKSSTLEDVTRDNTIIDGMTGIEYRVYGDFIPDDAGFSLVGMVKR